MNPPLSNLAFLVVDDNENMVRIVKTVLKGFGAAVVYEAPDVAMAFNVVREQAVDLAVVDVNMRPMDGLAFVRLMRTAADSPNPYLPIIMLSAYSELHRVESARDAGAHDFLVKPLVPIELYRKIIDCSERPRAFIRSADFEGPDRRRRDDPAYAGAERRAARSETPPADEAADAASESEAA